MTHARSSAGLATVLAVSALIASGSAAWAQDATTAPGATTHEEPTYATTITVPEDESLSDAEEAAMLAGLATVTPEEAIAAALTEAPGTVTALELESEDGALVYSVEISVDSGSLLEVIIDAGDGAVIDVAPHDADEDDDHDDEDDDDGDEAYGVARVA